MAYSPSGQLLATADWWDGTVSMFSVDASTGALTPVTNSPFGTGDNPHSVAFSADGELLATANAGDNTVSVFMVDGTTGALTAVPGSPFGTGNTPFAVAFSPDGRLLAVSNNVDDSVSVFAIDASTGTLTEISGSPFTTGAGPVTVAFSPDGELLATANNPGSTVSMFAVNANSGALTAVAGSPFATGRDANSLAFSSDGDLLATANYADSTVSVFAVNGSTGGLTAVPGSPYVTGLNAYSVAFRPGGWLLAVADGSDATVSLFAAHPSADIMMPADHQTHTLNQTVATTFGCNDPSGAPGISSCVDSTGALSPSGFLDTSALGTHSYTVTATSHDALTQTTSLNYTVVPAPPAPPVTGTTTPTEAAPAPTTTAPVPTSTPSAPPTVTGADNTPPRPSGRGRRNALRERVVLALTANPYYALHGVRPGMRLLTAARRLHTGAVIHVGLNDWLMATDSTTAVIKVRHGIVDEIGIADRRLTRNRSSQVAFIRTSPETLSALPAALVRWRLVRLPLAHGPRLTTGS